VLHFTQDHIFDTLVLFALAGKANQLHHTDRCVFHVFVGVILQLLEHELEESLIVCGQALEYLIWQPQLEPVVEGVYKLRAQLLHLESLASFFRLRHSEIPLLGGSNYLPKATLNEVCSPLVKDLLENLRGNVIDE
jgi:hypothetical protein